MRYLFILCPLIASMFLAMLVIPRILVIAIRHSLYDVPDFRKTHNGAVPRIGGVSFIPCILFSMLFMLGVFHLYIENTNENWLYPYYSEFNLLFCGLLLLYLGGVKDDLVGMHYLYKFIIQIISSLLIVLSGLYLNNMYGFLGMYEISPWIGIPLTVVALVFIINAINLIDGMDGLVSGLSIIALCIYGILFFISGIWFYSMLAFSTIGVLVIFFYYNVFGNVKKRGKLFMGDSGSMTLGFILGFLALRYTFFEPEVTKPVGNALIMAVSPLLIPIFDAMRVILSRIKKHKHLFKPDRSHIHHKLMDMGLDQSTALLLLLCINGVFCIFNYIMMEFINCSYIFIIDITLWIIINMYSTYIIKKNKVQALVRSQENR